MAKWLIRDEGHGSVDVLRNNRSRAYDLDDVEEAIRYIKRNRRYKTGEEIEVVEPDGYRYHFT
jgi:precorrin-6B methylase 2